MDLYFDREEAGTFGGVTTFQRHLRGTTHIAMSNVGYRNQMHVTPIN